MKVITKDQFYLDQIEALKKRITQEREGVEEFKQMMNDAFKDLEAERDARAAHSQAFYDALMRSDNISKSGKEIISGIWLCMTTPAACLAQVRAEAVESFVSSLQYYNHYTNSLLEDLANQYAERIRQRGTK